MSLANAETQEENTAAQNVHQEKAGHSAGVCVVSQSIAIGSES